MRRDVPPLTAFTAVGLLPAPSLERAARLIGVALGSPVSTLSPGEAMGPPIRVAITSQSGPPRVESCTDTLQGHEYSAAFEQGVRAFLAVPIESAAAAAEPSDRAPAESCRHTALCVLSDSPREWPERDVEFLVHLSSTLAAELALNAKVYALEIAAQEAEETSLRDSLTRLPNRSLFVDRLEHAIERARRHRDFKFAVLSIDIDRFTDVVDGLGHEASDEVVVTIARRLESWTRDEDTVARASGDEFLVLLESIRGEHDALRVAARFQDAIRQPITTQAGEVFVTACVGIALGIGELDGAPRLIQQAGIAQSRAKAIGADRHVIFDREMHERADSRLRLETDLRHAVESGSFELYYQPMVSLTTGGVIELEALVRWRHPLRGIVGPLEFIPLAEETGLIVQIGAWVLAQGCEQLREWQGRFRRERPLAMSVNVSARQLRAPDFVDMVGSFLAASSLDPSSLKLEITESMIIDEPERARAVVEQLRAIGVGIYLDDFGTGYSSLKYLNLLPFDALKIDYTFVTAMERTRTAYQVVRTVADLAKSMGVPCVAEGVESFHQLEMVRALGCDSAQGHLFSKPAALGPIEQLLAADSRW